MQIDNKNGHNPLSQGYDCFRDRLPHDPVSPFHIGSLQNGDAIHRLKQQRRTDDRLTLFQAVIPWHNAALRYETFHDESDGKHILFFGLGVGMDTPGIMKFPSRAEVSALTGILKRCP